MKNEAFGQSKNKTMCANPKLVDFSTVASKERRFIAKTPNTRRAAVGITRWSQIKA